jgi:hypothetical protein
MKNLIGWQRLLTVISAAWIAGVMLTSGHDYQSVVNGGDITEFVSLQDANTGKPFGRLSRDEIKRLGEILLKRSTSSEAEPTDAEEAKFLLASKNPQPLLRYRVIALWAVLPVLFLWIFYASILWVASGFRKAA